LEFQRREADMIATPIAGAWFFEHTRGEANKGCRR
jgi:hypothetical protein